MYYTYQYGFKTRQSANDAVEDMYATGDLLPGEPCNVTSYKTKDGRTLWQIKLWA